MTTPAPNTKANYTCFNVTNIKINVDQSRWVCLASHKHPSKCREAVASKPTTESYLPLQALVKPRCFFQMPAFLAIFGVLIDCKLHAICCGCQSWERALVHRKKPAEGLWIWRQRPDLVQLVSLHSQTDLQPNYIWQWPAIFTQDKQYVWWYRYCEIVL